MATNVTIWSPGSYVCSYAMNFNISTSRPLVVVCGERTLFPCDTRARSRWVVPHHGGKRAFASHTTPLRRNHPQRCYHHSLDVTHPTTSFSKGAIRITTPFLKGANTADGQVLNSLELHVVPA